MRGKHVLFVPLPCISYVVSPTNNMRKHANEGSVETIQGIGMYPVCGCVCVGGRDVCCWFYDTSECVGMELLCFSQLGGCSVVLTETNHGPFAAFFLFLFLFFFR